MVHFRPPINLEGENNNYVTTHKYLGVIFDSPRLTWKHHVQYLYHSSISRIIVIKALSAMQEVPIKVASIIFIVRL